MSSTRYSTERARVLNGSRIMSSSHGDAEQSVHHSIKRVHLEQIIAVNANLDILRESVLRHGT
jgi:hypothetical protein